MTTIPIPEKPNKKIRRVPLRLSDEMLGDIEKIAAYNDLNRSYLIRLIIQVTLDIGFPELTAIYISKQENKNEHSKNF